MTLLFRLLIVILISTLLIPAEAIAQATATSLNDGATSLYDLLTGPLAKTVAAIAIVVLGYFTLSGQLDKRWVVSIVIGIALIFGAEGLVDLFAGS
jgi:type IV secretion system protein VirB2